MNTRRPTKLVFGLILLGIALITLACQPGALLRPKDTPTPTPTVTLRPTITSTPTPNPDILAGDWKAETDFGSITFIVAPDGKTISKVTIAFYTENQVHLNVSLNNYEFSNFRFEYTTMIGNPPRYEFSFHFEFNLDGKSGTVIWEGDLPSGKLEGSSEMFKTD